ncbi:DUF2179 domain-containing protein [Aeribacillus alveayuensis]|uniref:UPF0316 protein J2S06_002601 n=1 Tax=Aeribacillus alveayuensis TaxID=279215 RepID=A0ABT9VR87_9BACI|nr:uncharacterized protein YebE (UPF0316 family) [Bacillus alveayuensis]
MLLQAALIFLLQILYVPVLTIRTIFLVKNQTKAAAGVGLLEGAIYIVALGIVFQDLSNWFNIAAYVIGFSVGLLIGGAIEKKMALGYVTYNVNLLDKNSGLVNKLREAGFGVTVFEGEGMSSKRYRLEVVAKRSREEEFLELVNEIEPKAFLSSYELRSFKGGYMTNSMKKRWKKIQSKEKKLNQE